MPKTIKAIIYQDGKYFCARGVEIDVFTQGKTLDELLKNLREAIHLHLDSEPSLKIEFGKKPTLVLMMEVSAIAA